MVAVLLMASALSVFAQTPIASSPMNGASVQDEKGLEKAENVESSVLDLDDNVNYTGAEDKVYDTATYTRNFTNTKWQSLYIPFSMNYADWSADFKIARINNVHEIDENNDGFIDRAQLEILLLGEGSKTEANVPYLVMAKNAGPQTLRAQNVLVKAAASYQHDMTSWYNRFIVHGTYTGVSADDMYNNKYYGMSNGALKRVSHPVAMKGYRWFLEIQDRMDSPVIVPDVLTLRIVDENGNVTGVEEVVMSESNSQVWPADVYNLEGKKVKANANSLQGLPKGVYIVNGNKIIL